MNILELLNEFKFVHKYFLTHREKEEENSQKYRSHFPHVSELGGKVMDRYFLSGTKWG